MANLLIRDSGEKITVISPNDESVLGTAPSATVEETRPQLTLLPKRKILAPGSRTDPGATSQAG